MFVSILVFIAYLIFYTGYSKKSKTIYLKKVFLECINNPDLLLVELNKCISLVALTLILLYPIL